MPAVPVHQKQNSQRQHKDQPAADTAAGTVADMPDPDTVEAADDEKAATFNIAGQRVGKNYKGIVVKAGRKVLQK